MPRRMFAQRDASWLNRPNTRSMKAAHADRGDATAACDGTILLNDSSAAPASCWHPGLICRRLACKNIYDAAIAEGE